MTQSFAVDVGGTFTDLVVLDHDSGAVAYAKAPTTPKEPAVGVMAAIAKSTLDVPRAQTFFHGTTLGLNAMLEQRGALTGLITTRGMRDVLELRRQDWPGYTLFYEAPEPLVPRYLRREVTERILADGTIRAPLDEDELRRELQFLLDEGVEAVAICFMHSYAHPVHERRAGEIAEAEFPQLSVTLSHHVTREYREYERTSTTVGDASIKRRMAAYIDDLAGQLEGNAFGGTFVLTRCDGGVMSAAQAKERPIRTLLSGPASGVMGTVAMSNLLGIPNLIGCDMGGTSFEASLVIGHEPSLAPATQIGAVPLLVPVIELATIGAGGGSIARLDAGGALEVGPQSAGSEPGPVAYGRGGTDPTFTDAALVSGLLDAENFLGGELSIDLHAAREAIRSKIAAPLGMEVEDAAAGIVALAEAKMAAMLEELTIEKGHDPRDFSLLAFGGGGSLVASALAARLSVPRVVVPPWPGTFSAWGMLTLDIVHDFAQTAITPLDSLDADEVARRFSALEVDAVAALESERVPEDRRTLLRSIDMRYESQEHVLTIPYDGSRSDPARLREIFEERHERGFGFRSSDAVQVTAYRIRALGTLEKPRPPRVEPTGEDASAARRGSRAATHRESGGRLDWDIYDRERLAPGNRLSGPAIVEEPAATTIVAPGQDLLVDDLGNLVITTNRQEI